MNFKKIDIYTNSDAIQILACKISENGITGFEIHDSNDFKEFINNKNSDWDYLDDSLLNLAETPTYLTFYLTEDEQGRKILSEILKQIANLRENEKDFYGDLQINIDNVREEDWENCWKAFYKPFQIGKRIIIKPTWESLEYQDKLILEIDPASSFGTGQHDTTRLCIEILEDYIKEKSIVLDLGCGSGILSIAAFLLGAERLSIVDISDNAIKIASENIRLNNFDNFKSYSGDVVNDEKLRNVFIGGYDIIMANIVADVIIDMTSFIKTFLKTEGIILFSGIISNRFEEVCTHLNKNNINIIETRESGGWYAIICNHSH